MQRFCAIGLLVIWVVFAVDYLVRLAIAPQRWSWARHNWVDLLSVLVPVFRPFRLVKELNRIPALRGHTGLKLRRRVILVGVVFVLLFVYSIALAVLEVERYAPGATIVTLGEAVWWACVTIATVGYGDYVPVTGIGRMLAVLLMIGGVGIIGTASATIVSALNDHVRHRVAETPEEARAAAEGAEPGVLADPPSFDAGSSRSAADRPGSLDG
nr:potassium channel family protein [Agromyces seonyuensis]